MSSSPSSLAELIARFDSTPLTQLIPELIQKDAQARIIGQTEDLIVIPKDEFKFPSTFQLPTDQKIYQNPKAETIDFSTLKLSKLNFLTPQSGFILAGGALISWLKGQYIADYDLFFINDMKVEAAEEKILHFIEEREMKMKVKVKKKVQEANEKKEKEANDETKNIPILVSSSTKNSIPIPHSKYGSKYYFGNVVRNYNTLTYGLVSPYYIKQKYYQFILRSYSTIGQVLHGFDLTASQIAFDGENFYLTPSCFFNLYTNLIYLDFAVDSPSYIYRISKYVNDKHFSLSYQLPENSENIIDESVEDAKDIEIIGKYGKLALNNKGLFFVAQSTTLNKTIRSEYTLLSGPKHKVYGLLAYTDFYHCDCIQQNIRVMNGIFRISYFSLDENNLEQIFEPITLSEIESFTDRLKRILTRYYLLNTEKIGKLLGLPLFSQYIMTVATSSKKDKNEKILKFVDDNVNEIYERFEKILARNNLTFAFRGLFEGTHLKK